MSDKNTEPATTGPDDAAQAKKPKGRYAHIADYRTADDGSFEYVGVYHVWQSEEDANAYAREAKILVVCAAAALVVAGCIPAPGTFGAFYVLIPYACALLGTALTAAAVFRLAKEGTRVRDHIYDKSVPMLPVKLTIGAAGALSAAAGELVHIIVVDTSGNALLGLLFAALMLASGVCLLFLSRRSMPLVRGDAWKR